MQADTVIGRNVAGVLRETADKDHGPCGVVEDERHGRAERIAGEAL
jgi:hypothetical protein